MMDREVFSCFINLAHTMLQVDLVVLDEALQAKSGINRQLVPQAVCSSYDDLLFGGTLLTLAPGTLVDITERFHTHYAVLRQPDQAGLLVLGPYLPDESISVSLDSILLKNDLPLSFRQEYGAFYRHLPVLNHATLYSFFNCLCYTLFRQHIEAATFAPLDLSERTPQHTVFPDETLHPYAETIRARYEIENFILQCVTKGDFAPIESMVTNMPPVVRMPNQLVNEKTLLFAFNTLLRKAIESAYVHPYYIDRVSSDFAIRIEQLRSSDSVPAFRREMARTYCEMVKRYSLASYSPTIRRVLEYIHFNLASKLTLTTLANVHHLNPNYLSTQFNREVGQSIPEYITNYRLSESCTLMQATDAPIGQIAAAVGILDANYFSHLFKKKMGISPSQYRQYLLEPGKHPFE